MSSDVVADWADRIAGAPASWGICEVPGWGHQLDADRVFGGDAAFWDDVDQLGPDDFVPGDTPDDQRAYLDGFGLSVVGQFCPLPLHRPLRELRPIAERYLDSFGPLRAGLMVLAADSGEHGYDGRRSLDDAEWATLLSNLDAVTTLGANRGISVCLHPHVGTLVETRADVERVVEGSDVMLCVDTGHLLVGGSDPVALVKAVPDRVGHVHIKDVDLDVLAQVRSGTLGYTDGVRSGMYRVLGEGGVDIAEIVRILEAAGYWGLYVPEIDRLLDGPDVDTAGEFDRSVAYLAELIDAAH